MRGGSTVSAGPAVGAEPLQRWRQFVAGSKYGPFRRARQRRGRKAGARECIKKDRSCRCAANQARHRRTIRPPDPDADGHPSIKPDGPRIAIAVRRAGLEGDAAVRRIFRRRRTDEDIADIPGRDGIKQPARTLRRHPAALDKRQRGAELRETGIKA